MEELEDGAAPPSVVLVQCNICERSFFPDVQEKHTQICQKLVAKVRRKVFDSRKQRTEGTEISVLEPIKAKVEPPKKPSNWRKQHEDFISTIRAANRVTAALKDGGPLPPPLPPTYDQDYIQCPCCQRRFNESAADRHIKICKEQHARMPNNGKPLELKKPAGSTTYKPPATVKKNNTPIVSRVPSASRLPQRSGIRQQSGIPSPRASSVGSARSADLTSPPPGAANKPQGMSSGYGSEFEDGTAPPSVDLVQCNICKRSFFPDVQEKHTKICQKLVAKRRKVFDSRRQRAEGTEISVLTPIKAKAEPPKKPSNWRKKHEDFISTIRAAKLVTAAMKDGKPLPPPLPPTYDPDYIQCPYCQRRFNESAADRHIKFCKDQHARMPNKGKPGEPKKPAGSTTYKPPAAMKKNKTPIISRVPSASSRLPQRSGFRQQSGIPSPKASSAGSVWSAGLRSPPPGAANKPQVMSSSYGSVRKTDPGTILIKKKAEAYISRNNSNIVNNISKYCHLCGTRYLVQSAKFCCECGMRRVCM